MIEPLAIPIYEAARLGGVSRSTIYKEIAKGNLKFRKIGRRIIIAMDEVQGARGERRLCRKPPRVTRQANNRTRAAARAMKIKRSARRQELYEYVLEVQSKCNMIRPKIVLWSVVK